MLNLVETYGDHNKIKCTYYEQTCGKASPYFLIMFSIILFKPVNVFLEFDLTVSASYGN